jgi:hypothetical protein
MGLSKAESTGESRWLSFSYASHFRMEADVKKEEHDQALEHLLSLRGDSDSALLRDEAAIARAMAKCDICENIARYIDKLLISSEGEGLVGWFQRATQKENGKRGVVEMRRRTGREANLNVLFIVQRALNS